MDISFDPAKNARNIAECGLPFSLVEQLDWASALIIEDVRKDYSERRFRVLVFIDERLLKPRGRPRVAFPKERINIRLSQEVIAHFKAEGEGWQTRIDAALRQFIREHSR